MRLSVRDRRRNCIVCSSTKALMVSRIASSRAPPIRRQMVAVLPTPKRANSSARPRHLKKDHLAQYLIFT